MALPHDPQLAVVTVLVPHLADQVDHLLEDEEADHGHEPHEAEPDCLLVLGVVMLVLPAAPVTALVAQPGIIIVININIITNAQYSEKVLLPGEEGVWQEVEQSVPGEGAHGQGDEELDEVLVEDPLHDRHHQDPEHAAQRDHQQRACRHNQSDDGDEPC